VREPRLLVLDIRDAIEDILSFVAPGRDEFMASRKAQLAVLKCFEIIGEAAKALPLPFRTRARGIPWKRMGRFRDVLTHAYHRVDLELVWRAIEDDLPGLRQQIADLIKREGY